MTDTPPTPGDFGRRTNPPGLIVPKTASEALRPEQGVPPPRRSRQSRNQFVVFLNFVMSSVVLLVLAGGAMIWYGKTMFEGPGPTQTVSTVLIKPNTGVQEIAQLLQRRGLISDARIFQIGLRAYGNDGKLKAGEYEIKPQASMHDIMELLKSGKSVLYSLTVPEGLTVEQAFQRIAEHEALEGDMPAEMPAEGMLATDTQRFTRGTKRQQIIDRMLAQQKKLIEDVWARRRQDLPIADVNEFVTLASIVEKETGRGDERSRVAAVFMNRLKKGMRLQSDPTIIYGLFINGLPPTPIANPGRAALEAVANPSATNELYFVADGTGGHAFATTLEEHNENVARWRELEKKRAEEAAKAAAAAGGAAGGAAQ